MNLRQRLRIDLGDEEYRHAYADEQLNLSIGTQIKVVREQQELTQAELAEKIGTKQAGISRLESANYSGWSIAVLRRLARAFDLRLRVSFEEFGTLWKEVGDFNRQSLQRAKFEDDPEFQEQYETAAESDEELQEGAPPHQESPVGGLNADSYVKDKVISIQFIPGWNPPVETEDVGEPSVTGTVWTGPTEKTEKMAPVRAIAHHPAADLIELGKHCG